MSGPILRKYGFPNFDKIFGKKELEHGIDEPASTPPAAPAVGQAPPEPKPARTPKPTDGK